MTAPTIQICEASDYKGRYACGRCNLTWDAAAANRPSCKAKVDPTIKLTEMVESIREEGRRVLASQSALVNSGARTEPYMPQLRLASVYFATADLVERIQANPKVAELLRGGA